MICYSQLPLRTVAILVLYVLEPILYEILAFLPSCLHAHA